MRHGLYYDTSAHRFLIPADGVRLGDATSVVEPHFLIHPLGFPIFLSESDLSRCDEYADGDPYSVAQFAESAFQMRRRELTLRLIRNLVGTPMTILDVGCGEGHITDALLRLPGVALTCGVDYSLSAIIKTVAEYPRIECCVADAHHLPYASGFFDVVVCNNLWEHVPNPIALLSAMARVLKDAGCLIISTPSRYRFSNILNVVKGRAPELMSHYHVTEYTVGQVREQLASRGFEIVQVCSETIRTKHEGVLPYLAHRVVKPVLTAYLRYMRSEHVLESTVFFVARRPAPTPRSEASDNAAGQ